MAYIVCKEISDEQYRCLLEFALSYSDLFCVSTFKFHKKDLSPTYFDFFETAVPSEVDQYECKKLPQHYEKGQKFRVFRLNSSNKKFIAQRRSFWEWSLPDLPEDLSFLKDKKVWLNCITHERMVIIDTNYDVVYSFIDRLGIQLRKM